MAVVAKLKFKGDLDWQLEHKLITELGFRIFSRQGREWLIVEKQRSKFKPEVLVNGELPESVQTELNRRCNTVVDHFNAPESHLDVIRMRINNIARTLPQLQQEYMDEWMERNLKENQ